jgi:hypothetical protein
MSVASFLSIMNILLRIGHFYPFESQLTAPLNDFVLENTRIYTSVDPDVSENLFVSIPIYFPSEIYQK